MKAILFDFGGTLDTNGVHWSEYFWDAYQHVHIPIDKSVYEQAYVAAERVLPGDRIRRSDGFAATIRAQVHAQFEYLAAHGFPFDPTAPEDVARICFTGAQTTAAEHLPLLEKLSQRYALAAVSNFYGNLDASLKELGIAHAFRSMIDSTLVGIQKPDARIFQIALDALHVHAGETYVVGDSYERDIIPAKQLGCVTVWLRGRSWKETIETAHADYVILSLHELARLFRM